MLRMRIPHARRDSLTELPGKYEFRRAVRQAMEREPDGRFVIARWDIDRFKVYNATYGIDAGDALLRSLGRMCLEENGDAGLVAQAHYDADHFVSCWRESEFDADAFMARICAGVNARTGDYSATVCFGFCRTTSDGTDAGVLCDRALLAMQTVKHDYERHSAWYDDSMRRSMLDEQEILQSMRDALRNGEFEPWFQPQYDYDTNTLIGAEVLVRWRKPEKGMVSPGTFIPIFEKNGFIYELDKYIWSRACDYLRKWRGEGLNICPVSVNVSRRDLYHNDIAEELSEMLDGYGLPKKYLRLEITESSYMDDPRQLLEMLARLQGAGFEIEIDDFGSGFSSLNMLKDVDVDALKLDLGFLRGGTKRSGSILSSVVRLAGGIDMDVIAEGVEQREQAEYLKSIGCTRMQGYFFARPMPAEEFAKLLSKGGKLDIPDRQEIEATNAATFLNADAQSTLLFNSFLGGATILEYCRGNVSVLRANDRFFEILKLTREEYRKDREDVLGSFQDPEDRRRFREMLDEAMRTGTEASCETHTVSPAGEITYTRNRARFLYRRADSLIFYESIEDITREKRLLRKNALLAGELETILRNIPGGVARIRVADGHEHIEFVNESLGRMLGMEPEALRDAMQRDIFALVHPDDRERVRVRQRKLMKSPSDGAHIQARMRHADGHYIDMEIRASFTSSEDSDYLYISYTDITDLMDAQDELRIREAEYRSAVQQSGRMICRYTLPDHALYTDMAARFDTAPCTPDAVNSLVEGGYIAPESIPAWRDMFDKIDRGESGSVSELYIQGLHGAWRWFSATYGPMYERGALRGSIICFEDTTEAHMRDAEIALQLRRHTQVMRAIAEHSARIVYFCEGDTGRAVDRRAAIAAGLIDVLRMRECEKYILPESYKEWNAICTHVIAREDIEPMKLHVRCVDGIDRWIDFRYTRVESDTAHSYTGVLSLGDVTEEHERQTAYEQYRKDMDTEMRACLVLADADISLNRIDLYIDNSESPCPQIKPGMEYSEAVCRFIDAQFAEENRERALAVLTREHLLAQYAEGKFEHTEDMCVRFLSDGQMHWLRLRIRIIRDVYSGHVRAKWTFYDVTAEIRERIALVNRAERDAMTGLLNRGALERYIHDFVGREANAKSLFLLIDMDDLKDINDRYGHAGGDEALRALASALTEHFARMPEAALCRLGGDEFAVFVPNAHSRTEQRASVDALCRRINSLSFSGGTVHCSIGCVFAQSDDDRFETLYSKADRALYRVKRMGKHDYAFFSDEMTDDDGSVSAPRREDMFDPREMRHLVDALSGFYPMVVSLNLDRDRYYLMESTELIPDFPKFGRVGELVGLYAGISEHVGALADPDAFIDGMRTMFERGGHTQRLYNRIRGNDGALYNVEIVTLLYRNDLKEICGFALVRRTEGEEVVKA